MSTITGYIPYEHILVILIGTVSSLTLLLLIGREMYKLFRMPETSGNHHFTIVPSVAITPQMTQQISTTIH